MIDIKEMRRLAQAATSGEWYVKRGNHIYGRNEVTDGEEVWHPVIASTDDDEVNVNFEANAAFIAAANPTAISELLDRLEAAEKERDFAKTEIARLHDDIRELTDVRVLDEEDRDRIVAHLQGEAKAKLDSLEATEKDSAHHKALAESALRVAKGWEDKCDELRAKIEEMERQKPVAYLPLSSARILESGVIANAVVWNCRDKAASDMPLYALPGAQTQGEWK